MVSPDAETGWAERHVEPTAEFAQLQLGFVDRTQWRYEVIRPLVLFADRSASQRARETDTHPDAGEFRIWSLLAQPEVSVRTVGRIMALNRLVYNDIPHVPKRGIKPHPGPHPYKATLRHQYWFIDGRRMDVAIDGVKWWSVIIFEGYSRTMLAGTIAPTEATWVALMVLYTACLRYGTPYTLSPTAGARTRRPTLKPCVRGCRSSMRRSSAPKARVIRT
jgi:hypothetical protein